MNSSKNNIDLFSGFSCPLPISKYKTIQLAHGSGGKLMSELIDEMFRGIFKNEILDRMEDQASLKIENNNLVFTTDSFVVDPLFFPGGNIGELAVNGTVNDLCMNGAKPLYLSTSFIIEEGFSIDLLYNIVISMKKAADSAKVKIVTGDTKIVDKGSCDKLFINTSGIGINHFGDSISASNIKSGDKIILSGTIADHGMAIMTARNNLSFENAINSDTNALNSLVSVMTSKSNQIHAMRDPTRGGVAATLNEFAKQSKVGIKIFSDKIPVKDIVKGACELLGIDPLFVANEGKLIAAVDPENAEFLVSEMMKHELGAGSCIIGEVVDEHPGIVVRRTILGVEQIVDLPMGEQLPRIC